jgi:hypothetical protein
MPGNKILCITNSGKNDQNTLESFTKRTMRRLEYDFHICNQLFLCYLSNQTIYCQFGYLAFTKSGINGTRKSLFE